MKYLRKFDSVSDMDTEIASSEIGIIGLAYDGTTPVVKKKDTPPDPKLTPFYIEDISGSANTVQITKSNESAPALTIEKSADGNTWDTMGETSTTAITATIPANGKLYLRCNTTRWASSTNLSDFTKITTTSNCNVGGNIMSLLYGSNFTGNETTFPVGSYSLKNALAYNTHIVNASDLILPATALVSHCYDSLFSGCTSLITAPVLPATILVSQCYQNMFWNCTNLNYINCTNSWVKGVGATGTFVKAASMSSWTTGTSGIPSGWTVQDATE